MKLRIQLLACCLCALGMAQAQVTLTFPYGGVSRSALVVVPTGMQASDSVPLVLALHGFTQNAQTMMNATGFNALAQQARVVMVYPNGVNGGWNTMSGMPGASTADDVGYLLALADSVRARWGTRYHRMYACGFSAGGFMSYRLACERPDRFEAVASVAGTMSNAALTTCLGPPLPPSYHVRLMHIHGTSDAVVAYNGGNGNASVDQCIQSWVNRSVCPSVPAITALPNTNSVDGSTVEQMVYAPCAPLGPGNSPGAGIPGRVVFLKVQGGGHTWPGNTALLFGLGNVNMDISASASILNFFVGGGSATGVQEGSLQQETALTWEETLKALEGSSAAGDGLFDMLGRRCHPRDARLGQCYITRLSGFSRRWLRPY